MKANKMKVLSWILAIAMVISSFKFGTAVVYAEDGPGDPVNFNDLNFDRSDEQVSWHDEHDTTYPYKASYTFWYFEDDSEPTLNEFKNSIASSGITLKTKLGNNQKGTLSGKEFAPDEGGMDFDSLGTRVMQELCDDASNDYFVVYNDSEEAFKGIRFEGDGKM